MHWIMLIGSSWRWLNNVFGSESVSSGKQLHGWILTKINDVWLSLFGIHIWEQSPYDCHGTLTRYIKLRVAYAPGLRERFPCHRLQRKPLYSDPGMHHGTCVTHVPWCMSGSLTRGCGEYVTGIRGACATRHFTYLARNPYTNSCGNYLDKNSLYHDARIRDWKLILRERSHDNLV